MNVDDTARRRRDSGRDAGVRRAWPRVGRSWIEILPRMVRDVIAEWGADSRRATRGTGSVRWWCLSSRTTEPPRWRSSPGCTRSRSSSTSGCRPGRVTGPCGCTGPTRAAGHAARAAGTATAVCWTSTCSRHVRSRPSSTRGCTSAALPQLSTLSSYIDRWTRGPGEAGPRSGRSPGRLVEQAVSLGRGIHRRIPRRTA